MGSISFPALGVELNPSRVAFTVFGVEIYWYALIIATGFLLAVLYGFARAKDFGLTTDQIADGLLIAVPCAIIGARLYYVIFEWDAYFGADADPWSFLRIRDGGLAIYGGVIATVLSLYGYTRVKRLKLAPVLDLASLGLLIGQCIGRWGNFINREAHGGVTSTRFFLRMGLEENGVVTYYHPTFLYESVWNLAGFLLLHFLSKKRKYDGQVFLMYLAWYGLGRAWIEGMRTDSLYLGNTKIRVSQVLAAVTFLAASGVLLYRRWKGATRPENMPVNPVNAEKAKKGSDD